MISKRLVEMLFIRNRVQHIFCIIFCSLVFQTVFAVGELEKYWTVDEYLLQNSEQKVISQQFSKLVRADSQPLTISQEKGVHIAVIYPGKQVSDYWRRSIQSFEARLKELNIRYSLESHFTSPGTEVREQEKQIAEALKNKPDYLVFTLDAVRHSRIIQRILARGDIKVILQNITTPVKAWGNHQPFMYVGFDHIIGTKMLADFYQMKTSGKGQYGILYPTKGYLSIVRGESLLRQLSVSQDLKLVAQYFTGINRQTSRYHSIALLQEFPDVSFIYACSTDIALGVIDALKQMDRLGSVLVNGWGGGSAELAAIERGDMDVTVMRVNDDNGVAMAEAIKLDIQKQTNRVPLIFSGDFLLVTKDMESKEIEQFKKRAFRYSH
jgi:autoinducer 2-binding periplasmic protein LuxP